MKRNSTTLFLESPNATTPIPWVNGFPDFSSFTEPTLPVLQTAWKNFEGELEVIPDPEPVTPIISPDPMGFRSNLYGLSGTNNNDLFGVYMSTTMIATNPATASAALTEARNILEGSFWNEPFSKPAFAAAYGILKNFLTSEQIAIFDAAIIKFNLM